MASVMHPAGSWTVPDDEESNSVNTPLELVPIQDHGQVNVDVDAAMSGPSYVSVSEERGTSRLPASQGVPAELPSLLAEIVFVLTCTAGQLIFALLIGHVTVTQSVFGAALGIPPSQVPWLIGSFMLASGLSVIVSGSLADLAPPKPLMVLFFVARAMQGLAVGVLVSASMSILGRVYSPGLRKTRVFSLMAAGSPFGYWLGCLQAGALSAHLPWIFGSTAIFLAACALAAHITIPSLGPVQDSIDTEAPTLRHFDYAGAALASIGCSLVVFGLTQGSSAHWSPYTYSSIVLGFLMLGGLYYVEKRVARPLIPNRLWRTPGFGRFWPPIFGLGAYSGAWQFYAIQFWQRYQGATPLTAALYLLPNGLVGVLAAFVVSKTLHVVPTYVILTASMVAFGLGPVFFLPQTPGSSYWALSMPGVALATFGPDMSFAAAAIFITSSVPRSYQGAAGSLLVTVQNLAMAVMTSICGAIGARVETLPSGGDWADRHSDHLVVWARGGAEEKEHVQ
ncbi:MFS general substrate transporter [Apiospora arundinis]